MVLSEKIKELRKARGLSQEEMAERLHVSRQTISKWEKGLSAPNADYLILLADLFEISVSELLGTSEDKQDTDKDVSKQLELLNTVLTNRDRRNRKIWRIVCCILLFMVIGSVVLVMFGMISFDQYANGSVKVELEQIE